MPPASNLSDCERWFVRRGVPHFIVEYDAREAIWTRSVPVLVALYLVRGLYALDVDETLAFNLFALLLVIAVLVATWSLTNLVRRRPAFAWPTQVGPWELAVFVIGPGIPSLLFGQWDDAIEAMIIGLFALLVVYFTTSYGIIPILRWAGGRSISLIGSLSSVLSRALPLLLVTITFLFLATEVWEVLGTLDGAAYWLVLALFFFIGLGFVLTRLPGDVEAAGTLTSWGEAREIVADTPARTIELPVDGCPPPPDLARREYLNVALVGLFARSIQIAIVAFAVGAFLTTFGALAISEATTTAWSGTEPNVLLSWTLGDREMVITEQLLQVAAFLATFAGLSFTVYLVTDPTYRTEFATDMADEVREAFAVRAAYRYSLEHA